MKCVYCGGIDSKVIDSRLSEDGYTVRRRRECTAAAKDSPHTKRWNLHLCLS